MVRKRNVFLFVVFFLFLSLSKVILVEADTLKSDAKWQVPFVYERRVFDVVGKGSVFDWSDTQMRQVWSRYEPTGLFVSENEKITVTVESDAKTFAYIQSYGLYGARNSWDEKRIQLNQGINEIKPTKGGLLYLSNEETTGSVNISVNGGSHIPVFEKGHHKKEDLEKMLIKYSKAPYVEYLSERGLVSVTYDSVAKYMAQNKAEIPEKVVENIDIFLAAQDELAGYDNEEGVHKQDYHYRHLVQDTVSEMYMYSTKHYTAYVNDAISAVLSGSNESGWGPWHENGHQQQQRTLDFYNMIEVQVNIFSLAAEKEMGFEKTRLESEGLYAKIEAYLNRPQAEKNFDQESDLFIKLGMLHQLTLSFGEQFYPNLYRLYREVPREDIPVIGKDQIFMYMTSKVAGYDLTPYFEMWGMKIENNTKIEIQKLNLPFLQKEIWKGTDSNPIIVPKLTVEKNKIKLTLSEELFNSQNRLVVYREGKYVYEIYNGVAYYGTKQSSAYKQLTITNNDDLADLKYGDNVEVYLVSGTPGVPINLSESTLLASQRYTDTIDLQLSEAGTDITMKNELFTSDTRLLYLLNGKYLGETYAGANYYLSLSRDTNGLVTLKSKQALAENDQVEIYLFEGKSGESIDISKGVRLASKRFLTETKPESINVSLQVTSNGYRLVVPSSLYNSEKRVIVTHNGKYVSEFYKGTTYYGTQTNKLSDEKIELIKELSVSRDDEINVSIMNGIPGESGDVYAMIRLLATEKLK